MQEGSILRFSKPMKLENHATALSFGMDLSSYLNA